VGSKTIRVNTSNGSTTLAVGYIDAFELGGVELSGGSW